MIEPAYDGLFKISFDELIVSQEEIELAQCAESYIMSREGAEGIGCKVSGKAGKTA